MVRFTWCIYRMISKMPKPGFYAVKNGRVPGIYRSWDECQSQVKGFSKPVFKKFPSYDEALMFMAEGGSAFPSSESPAMKSSPPHKRAHTSSFSPYWKDTVAGMANADQDIKITAGLGPSTGVPQLEDTVSSVLIIMEGLSKEVSSLANRVTQLESAVFIAPESRRNFSTMASGSAGWGERKTIKREIEGSFTGNKFSDDAVAVNVYTDGGCFSNGREEARAGIGVFWSSGSSDNVSEALPGRPSNNRAEIHAAVRAVQIAKRKGIKNLVLHTDSKFLINGITVWIKKWKRNGWKLSTGHPVINKEDFSALDNELTGISVKWVYIKGHSGHRGNEEADRLAKQGANMS